VVSVFVALSASLQRSPSFYRARAKKKQHFSVFQRDEQAILSLNFAFAMEFSTKNADISRTPRSLLLSRRLFPALVAQQLAHIDTKQLAFTNFPHIPPFTHKKSSFHCRFRSTTFALAEEKKGSKKMAPPSRLVVLAFALLLFVALVQVRRGVMQIETER